MGREVRTWKQFKGHRLDSTFPYFISDAGGGKNSETHMQSTIGSFLPSYKYHKESGLHSGGLSRYER